MRTKTLALSVALGVAGIVGSYAQVYSVNAVGYVNVSVPATGWALICNPLDAGAGNNTVGALITTAPEGTIVYKYANGAYETANVFEFGEWGNAAQTLAPGQGAFVKSAGAFTITFVGEVAQGTASNKQLTTGFNMTGSLVPQAGKITTDLQYPADEGDILYQWDGAQNKWKNAVVYEFGAWGDGTPAGEPSLAVGEAVFIKAAAVRNWNRNFSVNN